MAFDDIDEHEQGERVRAWLKKNGGSIALGVVVGLSAIYGWQQWQKRDGQKQEVLAEQMFQLTQAIEAKDSKKAEGLLAKFNQDAEGSTSQVLAVLHMAQYQQSLGKPDQALRYVAALGEIEKPELRELVSLRRAQLQIAAGKPDDAKAALAALAAGTYSVQANELLGDIARRSGDAAAAKAAYEKALTGMDEGSPLRQNLEMKMAELPVVASTGAAASKQGG